MCRSDFVVKLVHLHLTDCVIIFKKILNKIFFSGTFIDLSILVTFIQRNIMEKNASETFFNNFLKLFLLMCFWSMKGSINTHIRKLKQAPVGLETEMKTCLIHFMVYSVLVAFIFFVILCIYILLFVFHYMRRTNIIKKTNVRLFIFLIFKNVIYSSTFVLFLSHCSDLWVHTTCACLRYWLQSCVYIYISNTC